MKKKIFLTLLVCALFIPIIKASNDNPTINSTIKKDSSLDFDVKVTDVELDDTKQYEWAIVANQAATPENGDWQTVNTYTANSMDFYMDFKTHENTANSIQNVVSQVDTAYLLVREKTSQNLIIDHAAFDVSIPYAYGVVPYTIKMSNGKDDWHMKSPFALCAQCYSTNKYQAVKITDENVINGYMNLKDSNGEIDADRLADYINTLTLQPPTSFQASEDGTKLGKTNEQIGVTEKGLYFVWGEYSYGTSKKIYGVTIYNNEYEAAPTQTPTTTEPKKETSDTVESPSTGVSNYMISGIALLVITLGIYGVYKKKFN